MPTVKSATDSKSIIVLLVDNDPDCRMLIRDVILHQNLDNKVHEVCSGAEALDYLYRQGPYTDSPPPDLIYLDVEMPGLSGQETLKIIKSDPDLMDIPVVMMTGIDDDEQKIEAARNGANSYLVKSADPVAFLDMVTHSASYWLRIHQHPQREESKQNGEKT